MLEVLFDFINFDGQKFYSYRNYEKFDNFEALSYVSELFEELLGEVGVAVHADISACDAFRDVFRPSFDLGPWDVLESGSYFRELKILLNLVTPRCQNKDKTRKMITSLINSDWTRRRPLYRVGTRSPLSS